MWWIPSKRKKFEVRSFLHELSTSRGYSFPRRNVWKVKVALGVSVFFLFFFLCVCVDDSSWEDFDIG